MLKTTEISGSSFRMIDNFRRKVYMDWLRQPKSGRLLILQYHKVPRFSNPYAYGEINADEFCRLLRFLSGWFQFFPLEKAVALLDEGRLPRFSAAVTFDDGYSDWIDTVVPVLCELKIPATFFITSSQLGKSEPFWHERIVNAVAARGTGRLQGFSDREPKNRNNEDAEIARTVLNLQEKLKYMVLSEREEAIALLEDGLPKNDVFRPFTAADIVHIRDAGFQIGGHSRNHPILASCSDDEALNEIAGCKEELEGILREPVTQFAYPNGRPDSDFTAKHVNMVRQAGYRLAVTTTPGVARTSSDIFQLPRFTPWARSGWRSALQIIHNMRVTPRAVNNE